MIWTTSVEAVNAFAGKMHLSSTTHAFATKRRSVSVLLSMEVERLAAQVIVSRIYLLPRMLKILSITTWSRNLD